MDLVPGKLRIKHDRIPHTSDTHGSCPCPSELLRFGGEHAMQCRWRIIELHACDNGWYRTRLNIHYERPGGNLLQVKKMFYALTNDGRFVGV